MGIRVLLTGYGGDEWLYGNPYPHEELIRRLDLAGLGRTIRADWTSHGARTAWARVLRFGLGPLLPQSVRGAWRFARGRHHIPAWIPDNFAARIDLRRRLGASAADSSISRNVPAAIRAGWWSQSMEMEDRSAAQFGVEERHAFHDRRLIEFALALPPHQLSRQGLCKFVLRQAMRGVLPEPIRNRTDKAAFDHTFLNALDDAAKQGRFDALTIVKKGWVCDAAVQRMKRQALQSTVQRGISVVPPFDLWNIVGLELWHRECSSAMAEPE